MVLNSIAEVTVNTVSYAVDQGRYGASQANYITKSGTNAFHGNLYELWNGSKFNAADFFTNATAHGADQLWSVIPDIPAFQQQLMPLPLIVTDSRPSGSNATTSLSPESVVYEVK